VNHSWKNIDALRVNTCFAFLAEHIC